MSKTVELPNIGEGVEEADVAEVLVSEGDVVEANQSVMELETEKAVVEFPCPHAGTIEKILVSSGDTIRVGDAVLVIATDEEEAEGGEEEAKEERATESEKKEPEKKEPQGKGKRREQDETPPADEEPESSRTEMVTGEVEFRLPALGEGVDSADVAEILVSEGDVIEADDAVMELETEKAVVELPCPHAGKITKIHVSEGETISPDDLVLTIESSSSVSAPEKKKPAAPEKETRGEKEQPEKEQPEKGEKAEKPQRTEKKEKPERSKRPEARQERAEREREGDGTPVPAAPSTRRLARQLGVDLREVEGSARGGRITHEDVQAFVKERLTLPARAQQRGTAAPGSMAPPPLPDFSSFGPLEREKMSKIARTAAENLTVSWNVIPHVTHHERVDITELEEARKRFAQGIGKNGPKVTMTAIVMKALAKCLQSFPKFNSSLDPETQELVYKRYYSIGCAVDTPSGLLVPVIRNCDRKNILDIAAELGELAEQARDRKLSAESMQGATCTVTNLGGIGGVAFTPIINYPEVCILGMSRGQQELKLIEGEVQERLILPLSLSYDHRVINGADAARFMVMMKNLLADPFQMLTTV